MKFKEGACDWPPPNWKAVDAGAAGWDGGALAPKVKGEPLGAGAALPNWKGVDAPESPPAGVDEAAPKLNIPPLDELLVEDPAPLAAKGLLKLWPPAPPKEKLGAEACPLVCGALDPNKPPEGVALWLLLWPKEKPVEGCSDAAPNIFFAGGSSDLASCFIGLLPNMELLVAAGGAALLPKSGVDCAGVPVAPKEKVGAVDLSAVLCPNMFEAGAVDVLAPKRGAFAGSAAAAGVGLTAGLLAAPNSVEELSTVEAFELSCAPKRPLPVAWEALASSGFEAPNEKLGAAGFEEGAESCFGWNRDEPEDSAGLTVKPPPNTGLAETCESFSLSDSPDLSFDVVDWLSADFSWS